VQVQPAEQPKMMVRISPERPKSAPSNLGLPWLEPLGGRRSFSAADGFVPVPPTTAELLKRVHCDGVLTELGGQGPLIFQVLTTAQADRLVKVEAHRAMVAASEGNAALKGALAGAAFTDEELDDLGVKREKIASAADIVKQTMAAERVSATSAAAVASPNNPTTPTTKVRVGRKPPRGKAPLPGATP
jgi:hypothetical protein